MIPHQPTLLGAPLKKMLESRSDDALAKLFKTVETVEIVQTVDTVESEKSMSY